MPTISSITAVRACLFHSIKSKTSNQEYTCALNNALRIRKWIKGFGCLDSTSLSSSSLLPLPFSSLSMTWYRNSHHNTKEEEDNNSTNNPGGYE